MPFKKLHHLLRDTLEEEQMTSPTPLQAKVIPVIKSGVNTYCIAPKDSGKTTTLVLTTLQKIAGKAMGNAPRAIVIAENKAKVHDLYNAFMVYTKYTDIRLYMGYEELHIDIQKSEIFEGIDVLITTPKNLNKLFLLNGVSTSQLKMFSVEDADFILQKTEYSALLSVTQSIQKCQYVIFSEKLTPKLDRLQDYFMERATLVKG